MPPTSPDRLHERLALRMLTVGLYVVTTHAGQEPIASTVSWVTQVSIEPRLLMVALRRGTRLEETLILGRSFVINILGQGQQQIAKAFFKRTTPEGDTIGGFHFTLSPGCCPVLSDALAWIECDVTDSCIGLGDHRLVFGQLQQSVVHADVEEPLTVRMTPWSYG